MKLINSLNNDVVDTGITNVSLEILCSERGLNPTEHALLPENAKEQKALIQQAIADNFGSGDMKATALSLVGKTSNALSAAINIHMQVYQNLASAQTLADVRASVAPALPLMTQVGDMLSNDELMTVQTAQGMSDEEAVIEGLLAMTEAAKTIQALNGGD